MDPITGLMIGSAVAPVVGGAAGWLFGADEREEEKRLREQMVHDFDFNSDVTAQEVQAGLAQDGQMDPAARQAQMLALADLQQRAREGGLGLQERAQLAEAQAETERAAQANRQAVIQRQRQMGRGGGGQELAALLSGEQAAANRQSAAGLQAAAGGAQRAQQAMTQAGALASGVRGQDFNQMDARRQAQMSIAQFNARQRQSAQGETQNNRIAVASGRSAARAGQANMYAGRAGQSAQMGADIGQGLGEGAGAGADRLAADRRYEQWLAAGGR